MKASVTLIEALTVALELTNTDLPDGAVKVMLADLSQYPEPQVIGALKRCCRELKMRITLADILTREVSSGHDAYGRELALLDAAEKKRLTPACVRGLLPYHREDTGLHARLLALEGVPLLEFKPSPEGQKRLAELKAQYPVKVRP